jgi:hypothetical protein
MGRSRAYAGERAGRLITWYGSSTSITRGVNCPHDEIRVHQLNLLSTSFYHLRPKRPSSTPTPSLQRLFLFSRIERVEMPIANPSTASVHGKMLSGLSVLKKNPMAHVCPGLPANLSSQSFVKSITIRPSLSFRSLYVLLAGGFSSASRLRPVGGPGSRMRSWAS